MNKPIYTINLGEEAGASFYNGGWAKSITGIDKTKNNGYSLIGEFCPKNLAGHTPGLYLVCDKSGSRKNVVDKYTLLSISPEGTVQILQTVTGKSGYTRGQTGSDWAVQLWEVIEVVLVAIDEYKLITA